MSNDWYSVIRHNFYSDLVYGLTCPFFHRHPTVEWSLCHRNNFLLVYFREKGEGLTA